MANRNAPYGLRPIRYASGAPYNGACREYFATGSSGAMYIGDPVIHGGAANTTEIQGRPAGTLPTVAIGLDGSGDPMLGVVVGVLPVTETSTRYRENSTDRIILVADDPNLIFTAQTGGSGTEFAGTDVGLNCVLVAASGSTYTGLSGWYLNIATAPATTAAYQFRLERLASIADNAIGAYAQWEVMSNLHQLTPGAISDAGRFEPTS
jgi:hypothetical protein